MDLRTKLIFALVATSLISTLLLGWFAYHAAGNILRAETARHLDTLADARAEDFALIGQARRDDVSFISNNKRLLAHLANYDDGPEAARSGIQAILNDAVSSLDVLDRVSVYRANGSLVAEAIKVAYQPLTTAVADRQQLEFISYEYSSGGRVDSVFNEPLRLDRRLVGYVQAVVNIGEIIELAQNHRGLGETGEMLLVAELEEGTVTVLNPTRHPVEKPLQLPIADVGPVLRNALSQERALLQDVPDYRGVEVWAATRRLKRSDSAVIVKIDSSEQLASLETLREMLQNVALAVGALAILGGALLGLYLARPIRGLDEVVHRIRGGETSLRANTSGEDEVSFLAESLNDLMDRVYGEGGRNPDPPDGEP